MWQYAILSTAPSITHRIVCYAEHLPSYSGKMTCLWWPNTLRCLPCLSPQERLSGSWGLGNGVSKLHVCTAHFSQTRLNVADMLFCLLLDTSIAISPELKLFERCPLRGATANKEGWVASDEEQNDTDLKMSAGVAFLIVYSHSSAHRCAEGSWQIWTIVISYTISYNWEEIEKAKNVSWLFCWKDGSSLLGISLNLGSRHHSFGELWGSLSFWRDYRSEHHNLPSAITTATRPAEL